MSEIHAEETSLAEIASLTLPDLLKRGLSSQSRSIQVLEIAIQGELASAEKRLKDCIVEKKVSVDLEDLAGPDYAIRWALPLRKERLTRPTERFKYYAAHGIMCRESIKQLFAFLKGDLDEVLNDWKDLQGPIGPGWSEVTRYTQMTRAYLHVNSEAVAISELLANFQYYVEEARRVLGCECQDKQRPTGMTWVLEYDYSCAGRDLLLSHGSGRFSSVAVLRQAIELTVQRVLLNTENSKFREYRVEAKNLTFSGLLDACQTVDIQLNPSTDAISRIYDWGNVAVHGGLSYSWEEPWFVYCVSEQVRGGVVLTPDSAAFKRKQEELIEYLVSKGKIALEPRT